MSRTVLKFGGSNLKHKSDIRKIIRAVKRYKSPVIVVSAQFGLTKKLEKVAEEAKKDKKAIQQFIDYLFKQNKEIINENISNTYESEAALLKIESRLRELEQYLNGIHNIGTVPDFLRDMILSYGERFSSLMLCEIFKYNGFDCEEVRPEELNLITDGEYGSSSVNFDLAENHVKTRLAKVKLHVIPGFYGISPNKDVTLFGKGGSDYSAAAIAGCIDAKSLDVWKDVDGFMSTDPQLVNNSQQIKYLSYKEAAELAYFGAGILHPGTVAPLIDKNIPIKLFNINKVSDNLQPCSIINCKQSLNNEIIKSITHSDNFAILKLKGPAVGIKSGIIARVANVLGSERINIKSIITSQIEINILLSKNDLEKAHSIVIGLRFSTVKEISKEDNISVVAAVGEGITEKPGIAARIFTAVANKGINIKMISFGASEVSAYFIVKNADRQKSIEEIHTEFFSKN